MKRASLLRRAFEKACKTRKCAHAPYSKYKVGAALISQKNIYGGCNVENASYGATICAERTAIVSAVASGETRFTDIIVVTENAAAPCALCLQVLAEFCQDIEIHLATPRRIERSTRLSYLLRLPFRKSGLKRRSRT